MKEHTGPVAFFDFDGTLTTGDTFMPFLRQLQGAASYYRKLAALSPVLAGYLVRMVPNDVAKTRVLQRFVKGMPRDRLFSAGDAFCHTLPALLRPEGIELLQWHQSQGHRCVLVSASLDVYLQCWASRHEFDHVISTELDYVEGVATGHILGNNCHGEEKSLRICRWLNGVRPSATYAYGDTKGDLPMLQQADQGFLWNGRKFVAVGK